MPSQILVATIDRGKKSCGALPLIVLTGKCIRTSFALTHIIGGMLDVLAEEIHVASADS